MLRAILNESWRQHPTKQQLYGHLPPITKTIKIRWTRHAGHCWRSRDELISEVLLWTPSHGWAKIERPAWTYILQFCVDTGCSPEDLRKQGTIGRGGERGSGISVLMARHDDDNKSRTDKCIYIYIYILFVRSTFVVIYSAELSLAQGQKKGALWENRTH